MSSPASLTLLLANEAPFSFTHEAAVRYVFPDSLHVRDIGMKSATDPAIAEFALAQGLTIVSKDADFLALRFVLGEHVRMVWVRLGNGSTEQVEQALRQRQPLYRSVGRRSLSGDRNSLKKNAISRLIRRP